MYSPLLPGRTVFESPFSVDEKARLVTAGNFAVKFERLG